MSNRRKPHVRIHPKVGVGLSGEVQCRVLNPDGSIAWTGPKEKNLILYPGIEDAMSVNYPWANMLVYARAGTGTTANSESRDGTFARSGTTVTRSTGTGVFSSGDVGKVIKFGSGEEAYITSFTSTTEVEVRESGTIAATTIVVWNTAQTGLVAEVKNSNTKDGGAGSNTTTDDDVAGTTAMKRTWNFTAEVGAVTYTEIGISRTSGGALLSRIVLGTSVNVGIGQQLQVIYTLTMSLTGFVTVQNITPTITGWPRPYTITDITHSGTDFDVTFSESHHYEVGDEINIADAKPSSVNISSISSTVSDFTVTTSAAHGFSVSDSIEIEGCTVSAYNGTWTVASVGSTTEYTVTSGINPGAASDGTTRKTTPGTYFNGTWTIASIPTATEVRVTDATIATGTPADTGTGTGTLDAQARFGGTQIFGDGSNTSEGCIGDCNGVNDRVLRSLESAGTTLNGFGATNPTGNTAAGASESVTDDTANHSLTYTAKFDTDEANTNIYGFTFQGDTASLAALNVVFDDRQLKESGYTLEWGYTVTFRPTLA